MTGTTDTPHSQHLAHLATAGELVAARKLDEAEGEILRALAGLPTDPKALNLLALVRYKLGRLEDAHSTYREIAGATPQDAGARRNLGLLALKLGRLDEALPELEMAVRIAPGDERAWSYLGYTYAKKGKAVEAAEAFRRAGQDALASQLEQSAKVQRSPPPLARVAFARPVALAPPLPAPARRSRARRRAPSPATPRSRPRRSPSTSVRRATSPTSGAAPTRSARSTVWPGPRTAVRCCTSRPRPWRARVR